MAGKLRHRIDIQRPEYTRDAYGQRVAQWPRWASVWASVDPLSAREAEFARSFSATVSHTVRTRHLPGVLPTYRVKFGERILIVNGINNVEERGRETVLFCTEQVGGSVTA